MSTSGGIQAGIMWTLVAGIQSFIKSRWMLEPDAIIIFTGGDGQVLRVLYYSRSYAPSPIYR